MISGVTLIVLASGGESLAQAEQIHQGEKRKTEYKSEYNKYKYKSQFSIVFIFPMSI